MQAGLSTGSTVTDTCYANDQPQLLPEGRTAVDPRTSEYCHVSTPWSGSTQFKAAVVMPLWWQLQASANYQNLAPHPNGGECGDLECGDRAVARA